MSRKTACENGRETASTGRPTTYTYDQLGRLVKMVNPDNGGTRLLWDEYYQYDANGNMVAKLAGVVNGSGNITEGSVTAYQYDSLNRLMKVKHNYSASTWPIANVSISNEDVSYQYDGGSSLKTQMVDASGTSRYTYDSMGNLLTYIPPLPADYEVNYTYNAVGAKTSVAVKQGGVNVYQTIYSYFKNGWLKQVKGQESINGVWSDMTQIYYEYDAAGKATKRKNNASNDVETDYAFNARNEISGITHSRSGDVYAIVYTRDGGGNPLRVAFSGSQFSQPYPGANEVRYSYDEIGRLVNQDWGYGDWTSVNSTNWSYDWAGNRDPLSNTYNQADILNQDSGYKYDYLGNVESCPDNTSTPRTKYSYNEDNLLSQVDEVTSAGVTSTTMTWDADQARLKLQRGSDTWEMIFDYTCGMPEVLLAKSCVSSSTGYTYYVREPGGELVSSFDAAETPNKRYYHFDALGSTVMVTDGSGSVLDTLVYGAWGDVLKSPANTLDHYYYVGQGGYYVHSSTQGAALAGIMEVGVRFYDQMVGRFTQRDPVRVAGISDYAYAADRPTNAVDPTRRDCGQCSGPKANCVGCVGEEYQQCKYDCPSIWKIISHFLCLDRCRQLATACTLHCDNADSEWVSAPKAKDCMEGIVKKVITK